MTLPKMTSRREFVQLAGLAAGAISLGPVSTVRAGDEPAVDRSPDAVLARLLEGNQRFMRGESTRSGKTPEDFARSAMGQAPLAVIVACADSRVAPELIFDQGVGELFVVRVAGNIVTGTGPVLKGSIEFAVAELGCRLIMVLGHSKCGAVAAAIEHIDANDALPGSIGGLVSLIQPSVIKSKGLPGDRLDNAIKANVQRCVGTLKGLDPILSEFVAAKKLKVVGGTYELSTGQVDVFV
jgi:carbonic anhydrase